MLEDLEFRAACLARTVEQIDAVVVEHSRTIEALERAVRRLERRLRQLEGRLDEDDGAPGEAPGDAPVPGVSPDDLRG